MLRIEEIVGALDDEFRYSLEAFSDDRLAALLADKAALRRLRPVGISTAEAQAMIVAIQEKRARPAAPKPAPRPRKPRQPRKTKTAQSAPAAAPLPRAPQALPPSTESLCLPPPAPRGPAIRLGPPLSPTPVIVLGPPVDAHPADASPPPLESVAPPVISPSHAALGRRHATILAILFGLLALLLILFGA